MTAYVLDTDIMTLFQRGHPLTAQRVLAHAAEELALAVISVEEELTGWYTKLRQVRKRDELARVYQRLSEALGGRPLLRTLPNPLVHGVRDRSIRRPSQTASPRRQERSSDRGHRP